MSPEKKLLFLECAEFGDIIECLKIAKEVASHTLSAFEFMEGKMMRQVSSSHQVQCPFATHGDNYYYALIELSGQQEIDALSQRLAERIVEQK